MPKPCAGKTYKKQYTEENLTAAVASINDGMPKREAARKFNIPRATLQFRITNNLIKTRAGPSTVLTEIEENILSDWIIASSKKGFPRRKEDVLHSVEQFMIKTPRPSKFKDNKPGEGWYKLFLKRHPKIAERTSEAVTSASANVSEENIRKWFNQIENSLTNEELEILNDPNRIFNGDETGFQLCPKQGKVLAEKGSRDVYEVDMAPAKSSITVMFTFSASGSVTPPLVIYPLKRMRADIRDSVPSHWGISLSDNGWMTKEIFLQYMTNVLYPHLVSTNVKFPVILFVDGHKSHMNYELSAKCKELGIVLISLYPNATRILQPADVSAFKPIKHEWRKALLEWRRRNFSTQLTKVDFGRVLTTVVGNIKKEVIINGFRACGLHPWNPNAINYAKCLGQQTQTESVPKHEKKLTMSDFQNLVGPDILSCLRNKVSSEGNRFYKALDNIYKYLKDETISDDVSNDQRCIHIGDEWVPIDDVPFVIIPSHSLERVQEIVNYMPSEKHFKCSAETDQVEIYGNKTDTNTSQDNFKLISSEITEDETKKKEHNTKETKHVTDLKRDNSENRNIDLLETEMIKENNVYTEYQEIDSDLLPVEVNTTVKIIDNMNIINVRTGYKEVIEEDKNIKFEIDSTFRNEEVEENNVEKFKEDDFDNISINTIETENTENVQDNVKKLENILEKLDNTDNIIATSVKIEDFLHKAPTPKRKGKILPKKSNIYVLTSEKWLESEKEKQNEKDKAIAEKDDRKKIKELAKQTKALKKEEMKNKKNNKRTCSDKKEIKADTCKKRKIDVNKNTKKDNVTKETEKLLSTKEPMIIDTNKINIIETKVLIDPKNINEIQSEYQNDSKITLDTYKTESKYKNESKTIVISKDTEHALNKRKGLITKETDNIITKEMMTKAVTETLINTKTTDTKGKINIISIIPITTHPKVKRRLFDESYTVKPDFILPKILNRRSSFRNEQELQDYLENSDSQ